MEDTDESAVSVAMVSSFRYTLGSGYGSVDGIVWVNVDILWREQKSLGQIYETRESNNLRRSKREIYNMSTI